MFLSQNSRIDIFAGKRYYAYEVAGTASTLIIVLRTYSCNFTQIRLIEYGWIEYDVENTYIIYYITVISETRPVFVS